MYSLRLVSVLGSKDHVHQTIFDRFRGKIRWDYKDCPTCNAELNHAFFKFHDNADRLMVQIDLMCLKCHYSKRFMKPYNDIINDPSV